MLLDRSIKQFLSFLNEIVKFYSEGALA